MEDSDRESIVERLPNGRLYIMGPLDDATDAEALRLAIALIQATPEDDAERAHVEVDPVRYAIALIRAAGKP